MRVIDWLNKPRDPKVDPRPGDVLRKRNVDYVVRAEKENCFAITERTKGRSGIQIDGYGSACDWRKWAAAAKVIHIAEPE